MHIFLYRSRETGCTFFHIYSCHHLRCPWASMHPMAQTLAFNKPVPPVPGHLGSSHFYYKTAVSCYLHSQQMKYFTGMKTRNRAGGSGQSAAADSVPSALASREITGPPLPAVRGPFPRHSPLQGHFDLRSMTVVSQNLTRQVISEI